MNPIVVWFFQPYICIKKSAWKLFDWWLSQRDSSILSQVWNLSSTFWNDQSRPEPKRLMIKTPLFRPTHPSQIQFNWVKMSLGVIFAFSPFFWWNPLKNRFLNLRWEMTNTGKSQRLMIAILTLFYFPAQIHTPRLKIKVVEIPDWLNWRPNLEEYMFSNKL